MTEIPEHLRKRAEEARKKAAEKAGGDVAPAETPAGGDAPTASEGGPAEEGEAGVVRLVPHVPGGPLTVALLDALPGSASISSILSPIALSRLRTARKLSRAAARVWRVVSSGTTLASTAPGSLIANVIA